MARLLLYNATRFDFHGGYRGIIRIEACSDHPAIADQEGWTITRQLDGTPLTALVEGPEGYRWAELEEVDAFPSETECLPNLEEMREAVELAIEIADGDRVVSESPRLHSSIDRQAKALSDKTALINLLQRMDNIAPDQLPVSLQTYRTEWIAAGKPGL